MGSTDSLNLDSEPRPATPIAKLRNPKILESIDENGESNFFFYQGTFEKPNFSFQSQRQLREPHELALFSELKRLES
jgi:hypothetical protein